MKVRLAQLQRNAAAQQQQQSINDLIRQNRPQINIVDAMQGVRSIAVTPSPMTPNSTEELLPVDEAQEEVS